MTVEQKCDFCGQVDPEWVYPAHNTVVDMGVAVGGEYATSTGAWTACEKCAELIEQDSRDALAERALAHGVTDAMIKLGLIPADRRPYVKGLILDMHRDFFSSRTAARRRFG